MAAQTNSTKTFFQRIYNPLGFNKAYNFILWFIFAGALFGFVLARFLYLDFNGNFCPSTSSGGANGASPGECYWYQTFDQYKMGIMLHLASILPAGLLVVLQFTPIIRHRWILFHRINGYIVLLLFVISTVGVLMITRHAFGGGLDVQAAVGVITIMCLVSFTISYINIKRLQIEQHRAWMLRGWFYAASIITSRFVLIIATTIISQQQNYHTTRPCAQLAFIHKGDEAKTLGLYPSCAAYFNNTNPGAVATVHATFPSDDAAEIGGALGMSFGMALWVALWLHAVGIEVYLHLTPREAERLRKVSYQRQLEAGLKNPGSAGLTSDKLGDAVTWECKGGKSERRGCDEVSIDNVVEEYLGKKRHSEENA